MYFHVENGRIITVKSETEHRAYLLGIYMLTKVLRVTYSVVD